MKTYNEQLHLLIKNALLEDLGDGDHSTLCCIPTDKRGTAVLKIKEGGILAGMSVARSIFEQQEPSMKFMPGKSDGEKMLPGEEAFRIEAYIHTILKCERLVLNCMQRMSGIASLTHVYAEKIRGYKTRILDTRKTTPNFRLLEKEAVRIGGGYNHRMGLYDMIMLKDNHIDYAGGIVSAIRLACSYVKNVNPDLKIEIETRNLDDVRMAVSEGKITRIMLDNFTPDQIREALKIIDHKFETEASGGINLDNIESFAETGVDFISAGAIIHQAKSLDLSLKAYS